MRKDIVDFMKITLTIKEATTGLKPFLAQKMADQLGIPVKPEQVEFSVIDCDGGAIWSSQKSKGRYGNNIDMDQDGLEVIIKSDTMLKEEASNAAAKKKAVAAKKAASKTTAKTTTTKR